MGNLYDTYYDYGVSQQDMVDVPIGGYVAPIRPAPWVKVKAPFAERLASPNYGLPKWQRVFWSALSRLDESGHVEYASGELAEELRGSDGKVDHRNVALHVRQAIDHGFIHPTSTTRCVVIPAWDAERTDLREAPKRRCSVHGALDVRGEDWSQYY